jgi:hypothetical protein
LGLYASQTGTQDVGQLPELPQIVAVGFLGVGDFVGGQGARSRLSKRLDNLRI